MNVWYNDMGFGWCGCIIDTSMFTDMSNVTIILIPFWERGLREDLTLVQRIHVLRFIHALNNITDTEWT